MVQGGEIPYAEMFGTFLLSVGAAVSSVLLIKQFLNSHFNLSLFSPEFALFLFIFIDCGKLGIKFRWEWSCGQDGHTKPCGTLHCGTCTRLVCLP